ncbi:hypothetical protein GcC1_157018, partial [Golovinomyces cichoracearum]
MQESIDRNPPRLEDKRIRDILFNTFKNKGFLDGWRQTYPDEIQFIYWSSNELMSASRLDRIYVSNKTYRKCHQWEIIQTPSWTDHSAVSVHYYPHDKVKKGTGQWCFNVTLLKNPEIVTDLKGFVDHSLKVFKRRVKKLESAKSQRKIHSRSQKVVDCFQKMMNELREFPKTKQNENGQNKNKLKEKLLRRIIKMDKEQRTPRRIKKLSDLKRRLGGRRLNTCTWCPLRTSSSLM